MAAAWIACVIALGLCSSAQAAVTRSGTLQATIVDDFRTGESTTRYTLKSGRQEAVVRPDQFAANQELLQLSVTGQRYWDDAWSKFKAG